MDLKRIEEWEKIPGVEIIERDDNNENFLIRFSGVPDFEDEIKKTMEKFLKERSEKLGIDIRI